MDFKRQFSLKVKKVDSSVMYIVKYKKPHPKQNIEFMIILIPDRGVDVRGPFIQALGQGLLLKRQIAIGTESENTILTYSLDLNTFKLMAT